MRFLSLAVLLLSISLLTGCSTLSSTDGGYRADTTPGCDGGNWR